MWPPTQQNCAACTSIDVKDEKQTNNPATKNGLGLSTIHTSLAHYGGFRAILGHFTWFILQTPHQKNLHLRGSTCRKNTPWWLLTLHHNKKLMSKFSGPLTQKSDENMCRVPNFLNSLLKVAHVQILVVFVSMDLKTSVLPPPTSPLSLSSSISYLKTNMCQNPFTSQRCKGYHHHIHKLISPPKRTINNK